MQLKLTTDWQSNSSANSLTVVKGSFNSLTPTSLTNNIPGPYWELIDRAWIQHLPLYCACEGILCLCDIVPPEVTAVQFYEDNVFADVWVNASEVQGGWGFPGQSNGIGLHDGYRQVARSIQ